MKRIVLIFFIAIVATFSSVTNLFALEKLEPSSLVFAAISLGSDNQKSIEITNTSDQPVSFKHLRLLYASSTKNSFIEALELGSFNGSIAPKGSLLFAHIDTVFAEEKTIPDVMFKNTAPSISSGSLGLVDDDGNLLDVVCWATSTTVSSLQNCIDFPGGVLPKKVTGHTAWVRTSFSEENQAEVFISATKHEPHFGGFFSFANACLDVKITEISPRTSPQFIELKNSTSEEISLEGCVLRVNSSRHIFGEKDTLAAGDFLAIDIEKTALKLNKTTQNEIDFTSTEGEVVDGPIEVFALKEQASFAKFGDEWAVTFAPTLAAENRAMAFLPCGGSLVRSEATGRCIQHITITEPAMCDASKMINPETGRCITVPKEKVLVPCAPGQIRNVETNRCRNVASTVADLLTPCKENQVRNPETNRCRVNSVVAALQPCAQGQTRSIETNRCRKDVAENTGSSIPYKVEKNPSVGRIFTGWPIVFVVAIGSLFWILWDFREDIRRILEKKRKVKAATKA